MQLAHQSDETPPKTLYHYTSLEALVSIVRSKRLWASNIRFLNDRTESKRLAEAVVVYLKNRFSSPSEAEMIRLIIGILENIQNQSLYVASLSTRDDLLSQWRAYCPSGRGVSIGIAADALTDQWIFDPSAGKPLSFSGELQKVRYQEAEAHSDIGPMVEEWLTIELEQPSSRTDFPNLKALIALASTFAPFKVDEKLLGNLAEAATKAILEDQDIQWEGGFFPQGSAVAMWVRLLSPFVKHHAFAEEAEWRKVVSMETKPNAGLLFRPGKSTLVPYVEVMLDLKTNGLEAVKRETPFINEVVIGPTPTPELTEEALRSLFDSEGWHGVKIRHSQIPFRDW